MKQYFKIGRIAGTHGVDGKVVLTHSLGKKTELKGLKTIFTEPLKDQFLPWFIEEGTAKNDSETYLKIEGIDSKEAAKSILKKEIWLNDADFKKYSSASAPIGLLGFTLYNGKEKLGEIVEVFEQPHQILCKIMLEDKEALIPVHEETLVSMDKKSRKITVNLPPGLLGIYKEA